MLPDIPFLWRPNRASQDRLAGEDSPAPPSVNRLRSAALPAARCQEMRMAWHSEFRVPAAKVRGGLSPRHWTPWLLDLLEQTDQAMDVHRFASGSLRSSAGPADGPARSLVSGNILQAGQLIRENSSQEVFRFHPLQRRRDLASSPLTRQREGARRVPSPSNSKHWRIEQVLAPADPAQSCCLDRRKLDRAERNVECPARARLHHRLRPPVTQS